MNHPAGHHFRIVPEYQPVVREIGLDAEAIFTDPRVVAWRTLPDRDNCTLDATLADGRSVRWHIKRYAAGGSASPAEDDVRGQAELESAGIPTLKIVGYGSLADGRSFVISEDLAGYLAADKLVAAGVPFDQLRERIADLTGRLHAADLHHRDLYLCHFFARRGDSQDVRIIDTARVKKLPRFFARRWIVKDLAQLWYSTLSLPISDADREALLARYAAARKLDDRELAGLRRSIERKSAAIARHDAKLKKKQPTRNVSIPT